MNFWIPLKDQFFEDYIDGRREVCKMELISDLRVMGGCSFFQIAEILRKVHHFARGDSDAEIGRLLRYRYDAIANRLN